MKKNNDKIVGRAWIGRFNDGTIGWCSPDHLSNYKHCVEKPYCRNYVSDNDEFFLCEVSVRVLKKKNNQYIKRSAKSLRISKRT